MVRKAQKLGVTFNVKKVQPGDLAPSSIFRKLYHQTMDRCQADELYYFDDTYFEQLCRMDIYLASVSGPETDFVSDSETKVLAMASTRTKYSSVKPIETRVTPSESQ